MARTDNFTNFATDVADSIRSMTGKTDKIPAANFDTEIKSIETKEDLTEELNTYNTEVTEQGVSIDTIINALEGKAAGSGSGNNAQSNLNIFIQEDEPETKDGIWLQSDNLPYTALKIINSNYTCSWDRYEQLPDTGTRECGAALVGEYIYIFAGMNNNNTHTAYAKKYNIKTGVVTSITNYPLSCYGILCVSYGTDIYIFGGRYSNSCYPYAYKYDTLTDTYTKLSNIPISVGQMGGTIIGDDVYLFGGTIANGRTAKAYKYNISTDTYTQLASLPTVRNTVAVTHIGTNIYLFGGLGEPLNLSDAYKYDTLTNTYTKLSDVPHAGFGMGCVTYNNQIYVIGGNGSSIYRDVYLYNPLTDTYIETGTTVYGVARIQASCVINDNVIYIVGGAAGTIQSSSNDPLTPLALRYIQKGKIQANEEYTSDGNTLLIYCRKDGIRINLSDILHCDMSDVAYYSSTDGLDDTIPTYYGNGTEWVKFKN